VYWNIIGQLDSAEFPFTEGEKISSYEEYRPEKLDVSTGETRVYLEKLK